ncbi:MAG: class I SAM-dependent RNA methyltransferase [Armatimonadota bacterium]
MPDVPLAVGDHTTLQLDSLAVGGEAVGRHGGMAVFAMWGCPGDTAEVEITEVARTYARGLVRSVIEPSPDRVEAPCPHFGECGGCQLQHLSYEAQLRHKTAMVREALARIGGIQSSPPRPLSKTGEGVDKHRSEGGVVVGETWGMERDPWFYRNRAEYHAALDERGQVVLGFARHRSHDIIPLRECNLQHPFSERVRKAVVGQMPRVAQTVGERAALLGVETLVSFSSGKGLVTLICDGRPAFVPPLADALRAEVPEVVGVLAARRRGHAAHRSPAELVWGEYHVVEELRSRGVQESGRQGYRVSGDSFFQSNPAQAGRMVEVVREVSSPPYPLSKSGEGGTSPPGLLSKTGEGEARLGVVLDLYSGVGTFLLPLARGARRATGVEESESAVEDAKANARAWGLRNVTVYERRVERFLARAVSPAPSPSGCVALGKGAQSLAPDVVVLDPPRKGCGPVVAALVAKLRPRRIILVSCHPATLARDLKSFAEHGYPCRRVQPIDMFPQTWHVEAVAVCEPATDSAPPTPRDRSRSPS